MKGGIAAAKPQSGSERRASLTSPATQAAQVPVGVALMRGATVVSRAKPSADAVAGIGDSSYGRTLRPNALGRAFKKYSRGALYWARSLSSYLTVRQAA